MSRWQPRLIILQPTPYCNISCSYCYLGSRDDRRLMPRKVIDAIRDKIFSRLAPDAAPTIVWHAGEPTTAPISWYDYAYRSFSAARPPGAKFTMQSNGVAIDDRWIDLFRRTNTHVGLSIDGPQRFHDAHRRTRNDKPTWDMAVRALGRLQDAGFEPNVISVLHPECLDHADEYYSFYRDHGATHINLNIDEIQGANKTSSFGERDDKKRLTDFIVELLESAYRDNFPLHIREVERIGEVLAAGTSPQNDQIEPWDTIVIAADGSVSTFSPEFMEVRSSAHGNFVFGNIVTGDFPDFNARPVLHLAATEIAAGTAACRSSCRYFSVCGGGAPVNKLCETGSLTTSETAFCRLSIQAFADALIAFLDRRH